MKKNDNDDVIDYSMDLDELDPSNFLDIKKGDQLKNKKVLKSRLDQMNEPLETIERELFMVLYFTELLSDEDDEDGLKNFKGDHGDALDSLNDVMDKCSKISELLDEIKEIKNTL
jgi:hypothetical protein